MRVLYFDIDGTILRDSSPKPALADGAFERAVREAGFQQLVCVSNVITIIQFRKKLGHKLDGLKIVFETCRGTIQDETWFRDVTTLASEPEQRARCVDFSTDWWYIDDMARWYLEQEDMANVYESHLGRRVFEPNEAGDGHNVLNWFSTIHAGSLP